VTYQYSRQRVSHTWFVGASSFYCLQREAKFSFIESKRILDNEYVFMVFDNECVFKPHIVEYSPCTYYAIWTFNN